MGIESIVAMVLATAFLVGLAFYATSHRTEDKKHHNRANHA